MAKHVRWFCAAFAFALSLLLYIQLPRPAKAQGPTTGPSSKTWRCDGQVDCVRGEETGYCVYRNETVHDDTKPGAIQQLVNRCEAGYNLGPGGWTCKSGTLDCEEK